MQFQFLQDICYWNFYEILFTWKSDLIWQSAEHIFSFVIDNCNFHLYKQGLFAENKEKLITGALGALVLREGDQATLPAEEVEAQFHALRRLVASKAGFASLTSLPRWEIQNLFIVHLIMIYGFRKCFIILGNFVFCPILLHRSTFRITLRPQFTYIWWISEVPENIYFVDGVLTTLERSYCFVSSLCQIGWCAWSKVQFCIIVFLFSFFLFVM